MTKKELLEALSRLPDDAEVLFRTEGATQYYFWDANLMYDPVENAILLCAEQSEWTE